jgi:ribonuclease-3
MFADPGADYRDAKTRLQEWAQARGKDASAPVYTLQDTGGPGSRAALCRAGKVKGFEPVRGGGRLQAPGEQDAAAQLLAIVVPGQNDQRVAALPPSSARPMPASPP